jgi:tRNA(fMet)-specific endonuclease VapC
MTARYLFDTDTLSLYFQHHPIVMQRILRHLHDEIAVTAVTIEEVLTGWYTALRRARKPEQVVTAYDRLTATMRDLRNWDIVSFSAGAMTHYERLKALRLNVRKQDARIGAIGVEWGAVIVTRNLQDFQRIPGLNCEDWSI